ncbi:MAG TPA: efflux RND transporter periplasmic adaptor subunit [Desulfobacteria bacterium]|nr:efflux RND transporter periplasmic adaptor subunit [Desulfobacteria bacterium]
MNGKRKVFIISILVVMVITMIAVGFYYWYENTYYVSTEDARVTGTIFHVTPQIAGKLLEFNLAEGQEVNKGQIAGRQEMVNLPDSNLEMATMRTPIKGIVLKKQGNVGEVVTPGQVLAMLVNPDDLYISANIDETKIDRIKPGEVVDITIDSYPGKDFSGRVKSVGQATAATFSILPTSTGGNFTKVVQKIPVKISMTANDVKLLPGTSAVIKIHVK